MSDHRRFQMLATQALDFGSSGVEADELAAHLSGCAECRRFEAGVRADEERVRALPRTHAPDRVRGIIVAAADRPTARYGVRRLLPAVGTALIVVALLAGWGWLSRSQIAGPGHLPTRSWVRLGDVPGFANAYVSEMLGSGAQLIAVGTIMKDGNPSAAVWMSPNGLSWTKQPDDATFKDASAGLVAVHGDTLVVLGAGPLRQSGTGIGTPRVWLTQTQRSCDSCSVPPSGNPWQQARTSFPPSGDPAIGYGAITAGGPGFVVVGTELSHPAAGDIPIGAAVATSADGSTWKFNQPTSPEFAGGSMRDVAAGSSGLVAVGETALAPTIWTSGDGLVWTRQSLTIPPRSASLRSVAAGPAGFVAVGDDGGSAAAWVSIDGQGWRTAPASPALANARMLRVFWLGSEFVAIGETSGGDGIAWSSSDGLSWSRFDTGSILTGVQLQTAGAIGSRYLLLGADASGQVVAAAGDVPSQP
jgi:hypothetical protein